MSPRQHSITRDDMLAMSRADALMLGISGHDAAANATRFAVARRIREEQNRYDDAVYADAGRWGSTVDPDPARPFGLDELFRARGDVRAVIEDPGFTGKVLKDMGRSYREELVHDEDGPRYESFGPTFTDEAEAAYQAGLIHDTLAARGLVAHRPAALTPLHDALINHRMGSSGRHDRLSGNDVENRLFTRERLEHLLRIRRDDDLAEALQAARFVPAASGRNLYDRFETRLLVPHSFPGREMRHAQEVAHELVKERIDYAVEEVARSTEAGELIAYLPGTTWTISFGTREPDDEPDQADIDGALDSTWHFSSHEHTKITASNLTLFSPAFEVAQWIVRQARWARSPNQVALDTHRARTLQPPSWPGPAPSNPATGLDGPPF